jgi:HPt (histidine-containing phosphotransfer) domain-containing protein
MELFCKLVGFYLEDSTRLEQQLHEGADKGDVSLIERTAHSLKSLAANFDGFAAAQAAQKIEDLARSGELAAAVNCIPALKTELVRLRAAVTPYANGSE